MKKFICPQCKQHTISVKEKYFAGIWRVIHCQQCHARLCGQPIIMAIAYAIYFWTLAWFGFSAFLESSIEPLFYLLPAWALLDFLNIQLMPLAVMKARTTL